MNNCEIAFEDCGLARDLASPKRTLGAPAGT